MKCVDSSQFLPNGLLPLAISFPHPIPHQFRMNALHYTQEFVLLLNQSTSTLSNAKLSSRNARKKPSVSSKSNFVQKKPSARPKSWYARPRRIGVWHVSKRCEKKRSSK